MGEKCSARNAECDRFGGRRPVTEFGQGQKYFCGDETLWLAATLHNNSKRRSTGRLVVTKGVSPSGPLFSGFREGKKRSRRAHWAIEPFTRHPKQPAFTPTEQPLYPTAPKQKLLPPTPRRPLQHR